MTRLVALVLSDNTAEPDHIAASDELSATPPELGLDAERVVMGDPFNPRGFASVGRAFFRRGYVVAVPAPPTLLLLASGLVLPAWRWCLRATSAEAR